MSTSLKRLSWIVRLSLLRAASPRRVLRTNARRRLEYDILWRVSNEIHPAHILSVGVAPYTAHYPALFPNAHFETLEVDAEEHWWGSPGGHKTGSVTDVASFWSANTFDAVFLHGVYGWGLDTPDALHDALTGIATVLKPGGYLLFGWNTRTAGRDPLDIEQRLSDFFPLFDELTLGGTTHVDVDDADRVRFRFFAKKP